MNTTELNTNLKRKTKIPEDMRVGTVHSTSINGDLEVVSYTNSHNVGVSFFGYQHTVMTTTPKIRSGCVKNKMLPNKYGKGFIGIGEFTSLTHKKAYTVWHHMLSRCYCPKYHKRQPTYKNCEVVSEWLNFQKFSEWFYNVSNYEDSLHLDKDLKVADNSLYGPDTCIFVTMDVNSFLSCVYEKGTYGIGISLSKSGKLKVQASCGAGSTNKHIGTFSIEDLHKAKKAYSEFKYNLRDELVLEQTDKEVKNSLQLWKIPS